MKKLSIVAAIGLVFAASSAFAEDKIRARLTGYQEVPSVSTVAAGRFVAEIARDGASFDYELAYSGLQAPVTQAHIHFAQKSVNGPIIIWLCGTAANPGPAGTQTCPANIPGQVSEVSGTITSANVLASPTTQQLAAGELAEAIAAMRAGAAYANVHTTISPGGEIRGQLRARGHRGGDDRGGDHRH
jgi:hypothetical protein